MGNDREPSTLALRPRGSHIVGGDPVSCLLLGGLALLGVGAGLLGRPGARPHSPREAATYSGASARWRSPSICSSERWPLGSPPSLPRVAPAPPALSDRRDRPSWSRAPFSPRSCSARRRSAGLPHLSQRISARSALMSQLTRPVPVPPPQVLSSRGRHRRTTRGRSVLRTLVITRRGDGPGRSLDRAGTGRAPRSDRSAAGVLSSSN